MFQNFTYGKWFAFIIGLVLVIGGVVLITIFKIKEHGNQYDDFFGGIVGCIFAIIIGVCCVVCPLIEAQTESGKRDYKTQVSEFGGGITRVVKVYDMEGDLIEKYEGKFDVDYDESRIIFDDENGKRHIIYYSTGTIVIDEK